MTSDNKPKISNSIIDFMIIIQLNVHTKFIVVIFYCIAILFYFILFYLIVLYFIINLFIIYIFIYLFIY